MKEGSRVISVRLPLSVVEHLDETCERLRLRNYREYVESMLILSDKLIEAREARRLKEEGEADESARED